MLLRFVVTSTEAHDQPLIVGYVIRADKMGCVGKLRECLVGCHGSQQGTVTPGTGIGARPPGDGDESPQAVKTCEPIFRISVCCSHTVESPEFFLFYVGKLLFYEVSLIIIP